MTAARLPPLSALALARDVDAGRLTPAAAVETTLERIGALEERISAFTVVEAALARREAGRSGPLAGLALGIKDIVDTADLVTAYGSPIYEGHRPRADAAVVAAAKRAGAAVFAKTVTTEFAFFEPGPTRNPNHLAHTPGGSSSGSAAAVAAGMLPLALGTQTGGSVVRPAAFCGVAGLKPSFKLMPTVGMKTFSWSLDTMGLFGAGVADVAYGVAAITGRDLRVDRAEPTAPRIGVAETHLWHEATPEMRAAVETAARRAAAAGAKVGRVEMPAIFAEAFAAHQTIQDFEAALALGSDYDMHRARMSKVLSETLEAGRAIRPETYDDARRLSNGARKAARDLFAGYDVLLTPAAPGAAPEGLGSTGSSIFNRLWTLLGAPALAVPGLSGRGGLPLGVQLVAPFGRDRAVLEAGLFLERALAEANP